MRSNIYNLDTSQHTLYAQQTWPGQVAIKVGIFIEIEEISPRMFGRLRIGIALTLWRKNCKGVVNIERNHESG